MISLGKTGHSLGYGGIPNSIAIELDTWYNYDVQDQYENHISIQTRGSQEANSPNHTYSLGTTAK